MFDKIGLKIQNAASTVLIIFIIFSLLGGLIILWASDGEKAVTAVLTVVIGILIGWLSLLCLYAFGKIAECCEEIMLMMRQMPQIQQA